MRSDWFGVLGELGSSAGQAAVLHRKVESLGHGMSWLAGARARPPAAYRRLQLSLLGGLRPAGDASYVVDSSKSAGWALGRLAALAQLPEVDVRMLHLVRDPQGVARSAAKGRNTDLERGRGRGSTVATARSQVGWCRANALAEAAARRLGRERVASLRYEDLLAQPIEVITRLAGFLELDVAPLRPALTGQPLAPAHLFSGNRLRLGPVRLDPSHAATGEAVRDRWLRLLIAPLARRYGYGYGHGDPAGHARACAGHQW